MESRLQPIVNALHAKATCGGADVRGFFVMEAIQPETAADVATVAQMIQAKQREIAEQRARAEAGSTRPAADRAETANPVRPAARPPEVPFLGAGAPTEVNARLEATKKQKSDAEKPEASRESPKAPGELSEEERRMVESLRARDREVRDHEQAHARVGGAYASQPSYVYQSGPDGNRYAVGGSVAIDASPVPDNPKATIAKMEVVKRAALAPAEPSGADRRVAAFADSVRAQAIADLAALRNAARQEGFDERV